MRRTDILRGSLSAIFLLPRVHDPDSRLFSFQQYHTSIFPNVSLTFYQFIGTVSSRIGQFVLAPRHAEQADRE